MNCQGAIEKLGEHLDGTLPTSEAAEVEGHLVSCAACRAELEELRRALGAVKSLPRVRAPRGFAAGVMAEIRNEAVVKTVVPARVTPIRSITIFTRLIASIAAICLVWVGVRALRVEPVARENATASTGPGSLDRINEKATEPELAMKSGTAGVPAKPTPPENAANPQPETVRESASHKPNGTPPPADAADSGSWKGGPGVDERALAVQRITVYSSDIAVDSTQVRKLLAESGYTYSTQKKSILVRVPASEATRLVASLEGMPGGFRAGDRQSLESLAKSKELKESQDKAQADAKAKKDDSPAKNGSGLTAYADDLKDALRRHVDESRREIRKQEELKRKQPEKLAEGKRGGMLGASAGDSEEYGKKGLEGGAGKDGGPRDPHEDRDHNEEIAPGVSVAPSAPAGGGATGGRPAEESEKKRLDELKQAGAKAGQSEADGAGGTDDLEGRSRREKATDDVLADEVKKLESERKLADAEDAVVLLIEFETEGDEEAPAKK